MSCIPYAQQTEFPKLAREHNEKNMEQRKGKPLDSKAKFVPDFPDGEEIYPAVYQMNGFLIIGDKY